jgi:putative addiction module antidote
MAHAVKVERLGDDLVIRLPEKALARLKAKVGDTLELTEHPEGFVLSAYDAEFSRQMEAMRYVMEKHRDVLRMLSES